MKHDSGRPAGSRSVRIEHEILDLLAELVRLESPSRDKAALDALGTLLADRLRHAVGPRSRSSPTPTGATTSSADFRGPAELRPALVLGHFDTVWPRGTLERMPFRVDETAGRSGPGIFDMKASLAMFLTVMEQLSKNWEFVPRPIWVLFTSRRGDRQPDVARADRGAGASNRAYVLVLEPALADGGLKTSRKGVGRFRLEVEGKAAHAGVAPGRRPKRDRRARPPDLETPDLQDLAAGTTINVGVIQGGTTANVVPARASAEIDVRVASQAEEARIDSAFRSLVPDTTVLRLNVSGSFNRPPMERTPAIAALFEQAREIGRRLGLELTEGSTGGGSDGNFTAALGVPTLDGLGAGAAAPMPTTSTSWSTRCRNAPGLLAAACSACLTSRKHDEHRRQTFKVDDEITIRRAETVADYRACQDAQRKAWGISEEGYLVPIATMVGANLHGGLVLGAFLPGGEAVAMSFAFLGRVEGRLCLYSQLTGVVPGYQSRGLGYQIKLLQRTIARAEGIERIAWAFDPSGGQRPFQPRPAGCLGRALRREHVRPADRRTQRGRSHRPPDRRVGHRGRCRRGRFLPTMSRPCLT